jgi:nucleotide-binding universal stress UspA family protein
MFKTVLFPVDRSREAREAADIVSNIVRTYNSRLILLSVVEGQADDAMNSEPFIICDVADEINADLIVMGSRGMGLAQENTNESVTHRAIDLAPCPILIVP